MLRYYRVISGRAVLTLHSGNRARVYRSMLASLRLRENFNS